MAHDTEGPLVERVVVTYGALHGRSDINRPCLWSVLEIRKSPSRGPSSTTLFHRQVSGAKAVTLPSHCLWKFGDAYGHSEWSIDLTVQRKDMHGAVLHGLIVWNFGGNLVRLEVPTAKNVEAILTPTFHTES